jgi:hypothetical protein
MIGTIFVNILVNDWHNICEYLGMSGDVLAPHNSALANIVENDWHNICEYLGI